MNTDRLFLAYVRRGILAVDDKGRVWRRKRLWGNSHGSGLQSIPRRRADNKRSRNDYRRVELRIGGKYRSIQAHRLVYLVKCRSIPAGEAVHHCNGLREDNRPQNLETVTTARNNRIAAWTRAMGLSNPLKAKGLVCEARRLLLLPGWSMLRVAKELRLDPEIVRRINCKTIWPEAQPAEWQQAAGAEAY